MVGFYAIADESLPTRTDLDNELEGTYVMAGNLTNRLLEALIVFIVNVNVDQTSTSTDARWYTREDILNVLADPVGTRLRDNDPLKEALNEESGATSFKLPPPTAIAGVLIADWAHERFVITGPGGPRELKGNL